MAFHVAYKSQRIKKKNKKKKTVKSIVVVKGAA